MRILVTGGAGFIGSAVVRRLISESDYEVFCIDKMTYAATRESIESVIGNDSFELKICDIASNSSVSQCLEAFQPDKILHLAAESHVDRSIEDPDAFIESNIIGTYVLLSESLKYWESMSKDRRDEFRFHHVSTDEVFGDLSLNDPPFSESTKYDPSSPYSASKASADHLVRAWHRTYGLPIVITNCSNNYGPFQFPEKLIPLAFTKALIGQQIPIYGKGDQIRDWLYVEDHVDALIKAMLFGKNGECYNIGGNCEKTNLEVIRTLCQIMDEIVETPPNGISKFEELITFVKDRPGHDVRYAINSKKIERELNWQPKEDLYSGLRKTLCWYLENREWLNKINNKKYDGSRIGLEK
jgi:dTDP-glucose 4,6-dehydratase